MFCLWASKNLPFLDQLNYLLQLCFVLDPKERINALKLKARFEQMKAFLIQEIMLLMKARHS